MAHPEPNSSLNASKHPTPSDAPDKWNGWGPENKYFFLNAEGNITLSTTRATYPKFMPFLRTELKNIPMPKTPSVRLADVVLQQPIVNQPFLDAVRAFLRQDQVSLEHDKRVTHTYGRSHRDLLRLRKGVISRAPDIVLYPLSHEEVEKIVALAHQHNVVLVPYGGGSNIVGATEPDARETERCICSLDMRRMSRVLYIDKESGVALIEAGALGPELEAQLQREGYSLGHDPDSFEYSTLGGWLATCSSGMQSDKYGDIEDMCVSVTLATPNGTLTTPPVPRNGAGPNLKHLVVGSEGVLGVITKALMKVHRLPASRVFEGFLFPSFEAGVAAIGELVKQEALPSMVRLYDPDETRLSFSLKPAPSATQAFLSSVIKSYLEYVKKYDTETICLMITGTEGERSVVKFKRARLYSVLRSKGAFPVGTGAGETWHHKRYDLPLMRDWLLENGMWVDVCETSTAWPQILPLWKAVKQAVHAAFRKHNVPGWVGCHISHTYSNGCCLYFHFASAQRDFRVYQDAKRAACDAILKNKGALSHHHGVGYEHLPWMPKYYDETSLKLLRNLKSFLDPKNICNPGKLIPSEKQEKTSPDDGSHLFWNLLVEPQAEPQPKPSPSKSKL